jgi:tRNA (mo5U34)-methyltransferase
MDDLAQRVADHPGWYHALDLPGGVVTPGFCDLRPFAPEALPVSLAGKRCLDVGTFDGFWAYSMEARGADVVYALDLPDGTQADWPPNTRAENLAATAASGLEWGSGFKLAHAALGSEVRRIEGNVKDLSPEWTDGPVDVLLCGTILQHLRDPTGALERMRETLKPGGTLLMIEAFSVALTRLHPRRPVAEYRPPAPGSQFTWWIPNLATLRGWATTAGFVEAPGHEVVKHRPLRGSAKGDHVARLTFTAPE